MKSREHERDTPQIELFKVELSRIVDASHEMVKLGDTIDWENFERTFAQMWQGRPVIDRYPCTTSAACVTFSTPVALNPSSMSRWRKRAGKAGLEATAR